MYFATDLFLVRASGPTPDHWGALIVPGLSAGRVPSAQEIAAAEEACDVSEAGSASALIDPETLEARKLNGGPLRRSITYVGREIEFRIDATIEGAQLSKRFARHASFHAFCVAHVRAGLDQIYVIDDPALLVRVASELSIEIPSSRPDAIAVAHALDAEAAMARAIEKAPSREGAQGL